MPSASCSENTAGGAMATVLRIDTEREPRSDGVRRSSDQFGNKLLNLCNTDQISYDVIFVEGLLDPSNPSLARYNGDARVFGLIDKAVWKLFGSDLSRYFTHHGMDVRYFVLESSERVKTMETVRAFAAFCQDHGIRRRDHILCVGGGIVLDVGGLAANLLRRSTACIKIPTTLLGVVDAAVGVKTGVNFRDHKNFLGTYCAPAVVLYDLDLLRTLPHRQIRNGLAEIIKMISLKSAELTWLLRDSLDSFFRFPANTNVRELVEAAIHYMMEELQPNLREHDLKRIVDFGHEFGHPMEVLTEYELLHGEAVGIGMLISHSIAVQQGLMRKEHFDFFVRMHAELALPFYHRRLSGTALVAELEGIRRHKHGEVNLVALRAPGEPVFIAEVNEDLVLRACEQLERLERTHGRSPRREAAG